MAGETPEQLYQSLLDSWNARDAAGFAALFADEGHAIGFDGSEMHGRDEIERALRSIFGDHETASYVAKIREVRPLEASVAIVRAVVGMVPAGASDLNTATNSIQTLVARRCSDEDAWEIVLFQNTPAQYHGRPEAAAALTAELRELLNN